MTAVFSEILNMSMTGSLVILLVMAARLLLKRSPKIYAYALWAVVLFRLLCPVSLSASVSALDLLQPEVTEASPVTSTVSYRPSAYVQRRADAILIPQAAPESTQDTGAIKQTAPSVWDIASYVWFAGMAAMACYSVVQFLRLRGKLVGAMPYGKNVYLSDYIASPFVMGVLRPKVYLPSGIPMAERPYILAHEQHHIRRGDPLWKLLGYGALCIHWFNPLAWCAFILAGKDMEMSCDEAVIRQLGDGIRADYASSLLRLATHKKIIAGMPLAFGEGDTKGRVRNMANWKKPGVWVSILCGIVCIGVLVACGVNPKEEPDLSDITRTSGPADVGIGELYFILPEGFSIEATNEQTSSTSLYNHIIQNKNEAVGGVNVWDNPDFPLEKNFDGDTFIDTNFVRWVRALGLPEAQEDASLGSMIGDSLYADLEAEFFDDNAPTKMDVTHYFFISDSVVYDIWFDENTLPENLDFTILRTVRLGSEAEASSPAPLPFAIGTLPAGFSHREDESGSIRILKGTDTVGGIVGYPIPEGVYDPYDDHFIWLEDVGIPDFEDSSLAYMGGMTGINGSWCAEFASDVPDGVEPTVNHRHNFLVADGTVYDIWFDMLLIDFNDQQECLRAILSTVQETAPDTSEQSPTAEDIAFETCQTVMDTVQAGSYHILAQRRYSSPTANYSVETLWNAGDWLRMIHTGSGEQNATLYVNDRIFNGQSNSSNPEAFIWQEGVTPGFQEPWLACFLFIRHNITYLDTLTDADGTCYMFRADGYTPGYFVKFYFDPEGNFINVRLEVNQFQGNDFTVTESIVSLDQETIAAEINKEYQRAIG